MKSKSGLWLTLRCLRPLRRAVDVIGTSSAFGATFRWTVEVVDCGVVVETRGLMNRNLRYAGLLDEAESALRAISC